MRDFEARTDRPECPRRKLKRDHEPFPADSPLSLHRKSGARVELLAVGSRRFGPDGGVFAVPHRVAADCQPGSHFEITRLDSCALQTAGPFGFETPYHRFAVLFFNLDVEPRMG